MQKYIIDEERVRHYYFDDNNRLVYKTEITYAVKEFDPLMCSMRYRITGLHSLEAAHTYLENVLAKEED